MSVSMRFGRFSGGLKLLWTTGFLLSFMEFEGLGCTPSGGIRWQGCPLLAPLVWSRTVVLQALASNSRSDVRVKKQTLNDVIISAACHFRCEHLWYRFWLRLAVRELLCGGLVLPFQRIPELLAAFCLLVQSTCVLDQKVQ